MEKPYIKFKVRIDKKLETTKPLAIVVNDYYDISESVSKVFSKLCENKKISSNIIPVFYSIQINFDGLVENFMLLNYDICFKILRTIIEQTIIFNALCNNNEIMSDNFINWDLLENIKDYSFNKVGKDYTDCKNRLEKFIKLRYPYDSDKAKKMIKNLVKNNYGWYYINWDFKSDLNLYKIAEQEKLIDLYDLFKKYSLNIHNNKLRTILKQNKYDTEYGCSVVIGMFKSLKSIIQVLQNFIIDENQKYIHFDDVDILICSKLVDSIIKQNLEILEEQKMLNMSKQ